MTNFQVSKSFSLRQNRTAPRVSQHKVQSCLVNRIAMYYMFLFIFVFKKFEVLILFKRIMHISCISFQIYTLEFIFYAFENVIWFALHVVGLETLKIFQHLLKARWLCVFILSFNFVCYLPLHYLFNNVLSTLSVYIYM